MQTNPCIKTEMVEGFDVELLQKKKLPHFKSPLKHDPVWGPVVVIQLL